MKLENLKKAATLQNQITCEENNDTRLPNTDELKKQLEQTGISSSDAQLVSTMCFRYHNQLQSALKFAELKVYQSYLNSYAAYLDKEESGANKDATRLFEISAELEV